MNHQHFMQLALAEAEQARRENEVPIGAVIVCQGRVIASATTNGSNWATLPPTPR